MNYLQQNCQRANHILLIGLLVFSVFSGCSSDPQPIAKKETAVGVKAKPVWFNAPERFRYLNKMGEIVPHPFFDLTSFRTKDKPDLSYFLTTPVDSQHHYDLDLVSGELFRRQTFCAQKDVWENYGSKINRPNFSLGIVPRLLDQANMPQQIWVFGSKESLLIDEDRLIVQSQRARVVGGVLLQFCNEYPCRQKINWLSRLILIAVNPFDSTFKDVKNLSDLKKNVDWGYTKAFAENGFGRSMFGPKPVPAYRLVGEIGPEVALDNAFKLGTSFPFSKINSLRKNCYFLYDYLWRSQAKIRKEMKRIQKEKQEATRKLTQRGKEIMAMRRFQKITVFNDDIRKNIEEDEKEKELELSVDWARFFLYFYEKYGDQYRTCSKFVRPATTRDNPERFWFFSYLTNWFHLEDLDYYYLCSRRTWVKNTRLASGKRRYDIKKKRFCTSAEIDESFEQAVTVMSAVENSDKPHYRFLEYDNRIGGSHQQLFSWVRSEGKSLGCNARNKEKKSPIFPRDVNWDSFTKDLRKDRFDLIR